MALPPTEVSHLRSDVTGLQLDMRRLQGQVSRMNSSIQDIHVTIARLTKQDTVQQPMVDESDDEEFKEKEFYRYCMAKALQRHMVSIVEYVPYNSEVPHILVSTDNFNDSEQETITDNKKDSKAKMRSLVVRMRHRSLEAMTTLVNTFQVHNPSLYDSIWNTYESLKTTERNNYDKRRCSACLLIEGVCLCDVVDHLDQNELLLPKIHLKIAESNAEFVDEKPLWHLLFQSLNDTNYKKAMNVIIEALEKKGPFCEHIVQSIRKDIVYGRNAFHCVCQESFQRFNQAKRDFDTMSTSSDDLPKTSSSECSIKTDTVKRRRKSTTQARSHSIAATRTRMPPRILHARTQDKSRKSLDVRSTRRALIQWRKLKIITFFLTKLLLKLSKPT